MSPPLLATVDVCVVGSGAAGSAAGTPGGRGGGRGPRPPPLSASVAAAVVAEGAAGSTAAIAAARGGARVLLIEKLPFLGGTSTAVLDTFYGFSNTGARPH